MRCKTEATSPSLSHAEPGRKSELKLARRGIMARSQFHTLHAQAPNCVLSEVYGFELTASYCFQPLQKCKCLFPSQCVCCGCVSLERLRKSFRLTPYVDAHLSSNGENEMLKELAFSKHVASSINYRTRQNRHLKSRFLSKIPS